MSSASMVDHLTWLYAPGDRLDLIDKALASAADMVVVDLEDAVHPSSKAAARRNVVESLEAAPRPFFVRVNHPRSDWGQDDVAAVAGSENLAGLRLPKVGGVGDVRLAAGWVSEWSVPLHCYLESAIGVERSFEIASEPGVVGLGLGEADLIASLNVSDDQGLMWARGRTVVAAAAAGLPPPPQSVYANHHDIEGLVASCRIGKQLGFFGRSAIHPRQLRAIVASYLPSQEEVDRARAIRDASETMEQSGTGAWSDGSGQFIDRAVVAGSRRVLRLADRFGTA